MPGAVKIRTSVRTHLILDTCMRAHALMHAVAPQTRILILMERWRGGAGVHIPSVGGPSAIEESVAHVCRHAHMRIRAHLHIGKDLDMN